MIGVLAVERSYPALERHLCGMAWDGHHLWYADAGTDRLYCLDAHTGTVLQEVVCPEVRTGLTSEAPRCGRWLDTPGGSVSSIQPTDSRPADRAWGRCRGHERSIREWHILLAWARTGGKD